MRRLFPLLALLLLLSGCGAQQTEGFTVACTTYPVYLLANSIAGDVDGVEVKLVVNQQVSCLHDYALTVSDMKTIEEADVVAINGAGLEDFLGDALHGKQVIHCDEDIPLLESGEDDHHHEEDHHDEGHHHDGADPHIWMDPDNYAQMARNLAEGLAGMDSAHGEQYRSRGEETARELERFGAQLRDSEAGQGIRGIDMITFHDGFAYFAQSMGVHIAAAIEEEEGAEASAKALGETIEIVEGEGLPAVFTEVNGSGNAARIICAECGISSYPLSMVMSGHTGDTVEAYEQALEQNVETIWEAYR